jgi:alpha-mannosidase
VFRYSLSSGAGDWKVAKAYQSGMGLTNPLFPVSVVDTVSRKTFPPKQSLCATERPNLVISAIKKRDDSEDLLVRVYETEGEAVRSGIEFLGRRRTFNETNLLEEDLPGQPKDVVEAGPWAIRTLKLRLERGPAQGR